MEKQSLPGVEIWGGLECTCNRVNDDYFDQLEYNGHYEREDDLKLISELGIKKLRYPILWEKHMPEPGRLIDWSATAKRLDKLRETGVEPIAGLVHHGSGPAWVHMAEESFATGLAAYAREVAERFPWIEYYTPVNEPLTTARFCGLYGIWHPHHKDVLEFARILLNECKATVLAMQAIREINPNAKLVQTDDLGKTHSTPLLAYQAQHENVRRWLTFDLLSGRVHHDHGMWHFLTHIGIPSADLQFFLDNVCKPDIIGINHYLTSERYLDERLENYPVHTYGGNGRHQYADVEAVRVGHAKPEGLYGLLKEVFNRYGDVKVAVTEVHLHCTREEQMRWLDEIWHDTNQLREEGYQLEAITAWAVLGSHGWNKLLTKPNGDYETGVFDLRSGYARKTILGHMLQQYSAGKNFHHPVLDVHGWWKRPVRAIYCHDATPMQEEQKKTIQPLLIVGKSGTLGKAFARICESRGIVYEHLGRQEMDITNPVQVERVIAEKKPWAIVNTAGFVRVDDAETDRDACFLLNTAGAENLATLCEKYSVRLLTYSTDLVFNGSKNKPYTESDNKSPLNIYGESKSLAEARVLAGNPDALIIRTSAFFGPWDQYNFIQVALNELRQGKEFAAAADVYISPTYVPDLVNNSLDLLLDGEHGIWHMSNQGEISWANLAYAVAEKEGIRTSLVRSLPLTNFRYKAKRPQYSVLGSEKGLLLPSLYDALERYFAEKRSA
ncbi:sugar nucleotide-binding protein [Mucilaginibacter sp. RS28]|uniref:dTDP-4-dehydrorhamnose reductase n=1 Tax=Mucilaginibacter straminoryzae TaxID=2932774 RepID=A0A9X2BEQ1_9SPHI|nr:family 1 glycosylhydrolase [Mucilaginibacter straminoryzae]MCJ8211638.1 sugar nucleotide-binding protein [Mucilaginibacter straminoryzae]